MKRQNLSLLLEQLEDRIFLDANPLLIADGSVDPTVDPVAEAPVESAVEAAATEPENKEQQTDIDVVVEEEAFSTDDTNSKDTSEQEDAVATQENETSWEDSNGEVPQAAETEIQVEQNTDTTELTAVTSDTGDESEESDVDIKQVVFVDDSVKDYDTLLCGIVADISSDTSGSDEGHDEEQSSEQSYNGKQIITLDASQDEFQQITETLSEYSDLEGIHIISHGSNSSIRLGETTLDSENLDEHASQLSQWGEALSEDGDLLLYGCNVADDGIGVEFIEAVSVITGADVAASDDATGNIRSGGNWDLEVATGVIDVEVLQDANGNWDGLLAPPDPTSIGEVTNTTPMINSQFDFTVTFDNDTNDNLATETGYGPFVDVIIPNEIEIVGSPTVFASSISPSIFTWNGTDWIDEDGVALIEHPGETTGSITDRDLEMPQGTFNVGDKWYFIEQPFGSFTTGQPSIGVDFTATASTSVGAVVGTDYEILHRGGFSYGETATNDTGPIQEGTTGAITITPQVIDILKTNDAPEAQTVTGPNYPVEYTLTINIAGGETVTNVIVQDYLPENAVYRGDVAIAPVGGSGAPAIVPVSTTEPTPWTVLGADPLDRLLELDLGSLTGVVNPDSGHTEWEISYTVYFSSVEAGVTPNPLLPGTGGDLVVENESSITGQYGVDEVSDGVSSDNDTESDNEIQLASIVTYKDVEVVGGGDPYPGATLEWTLEVDISDYYAADDIVLSDVFADGQSFDTAFVPTFVLHQNGTTTPGIFTSYTVGTEDGYDDGLGAPIEGTGLTQILFNVSDQLGILEGGFIADGTVSGADESTDPLNGRIGGDGTYATITFQTIIDQDFDEFHTSTGGTGDSSVDIGDSINNDVDVTASIADGDLSTPDENQTDHSATGVSIEAGVVLKEIYAVNGLTNPDLGDGVTSGDEVTYRLRLEIPVADFENLVVTDYLPLPVYDVTELDAGANTNDFNGVRNLVPGEVEFGPDHTLDSTNISGLVYNSDPGIDIASPLAPDVTFDSINNAVTFDFGSYDTDSDTPQTVVIDVLITVTIQNQAMVDELQLTNQGQWSFNDTTSQVTQDDKIVQITLNEPEVNIVKGVIGTDNNESEFTLSPIGPSEITFNSATGTLDFNGVDPVEAADLEGTPLNSDLTGAEEGDLVTFAVAIYNTGGADAFDIHVADDIPSGFVKPGAGINLQIYDGAGTLVPAGNYTVTDLFTSGVDFHDAALEGNPDNRGHAGGSDVFIITYQLEVEDATNTVEAGSDLANTATVDFFTGVDDDTVDWTERLGEPEDVAVATIAEPGTLTKVLDGTKIDNTTNGQYESVIGEIATYTVTMSVPEAVSPGVFFMDTLDPGLNYLAGSFSIESVAGGLERTDGTEITLANLVLSGPAANGADGVQNIGFDFGDIVNTNTNNTAEIIEVTYDVYVTNVSTNQAGTTLDNSAYISYNSGEETESVSADHDITVIEPDLEVLKEVEVGGDGNAGGDAGDSVTYTITIQHSTASETDAFDVTFADQIPGEIDLTGPGAGISDVTDTAGFLETGDFTLLGQDLTLNGDIDMPEARIITITVTGTLVAGVTPAQTITNSANVQWESLGGIDPDTGLPYHQDGTANERTGDGGVDNYSDTGSATITITSVTVAKSLIDTEISDDAQNPDLVDEVGVNERLEAIIGEEATYEVVITMPESTMDAATLVDTLDAGLIIQRIDVVTPTGDLASTVALDDVGVTYTTSGTGATDEPQTVTFSLGDMTNGSNDGGAETLTIRYTVLVLNDEGNNDGDTLNNSAQFNYTGGSSNIDSADEDITIIEPVISTVKIINGIANPGEATVEVGDILTYTVVLTNTGNASAFEVTAVDALAPGTRYYTDGTHTPNASIDGVTITDNTNGNGLDNGTIEITSGADGWDLAEGASVSITYYALVGAAYFDSTYGMTGANLTNTVDADWSSNDDTASLTASDLDREYDDGENGHNYTVDGSQDADPAVFNIDYNGSLGDMVFFDSLGDGGVFNSAEGDVGIDGVTVTLQAIVDGVSHTWNEVTGAGPGGVTGYYFFDNLPIFDDYTITVDYSGTQGGTDLEDTHGYLPTYDFDQGTHGLNNEVTGLEITAANPTLHSADVDFGYTGQNFVGDTIWYDINDNGVQEANEDGINGLSVTLTADIDGDGIYEYTAQKTTQNIGGLDGQYGFTQLPAGDYRITVTPPTDSEQTWDYDDGLAASDDMAEFSLIADEDNFDIDFGYRGTASIGDFVWFDTNADSIQNEAVTSGVAGVDLTLSGDIDGDSTVDYTVTTTTADDGSYLFDYLLGGTYTISLDNSTLPSGASNWNQTFDLDEAAPIALDDTATGIVLANGEDRDEVDFGYAGTGSLGDRVWYDLDADGVQDAGELGMEGVEVQITADVDGDGTDEYDTSVVTDANGNYTFDNLPAAEYTITVNPATLPGGAMATYDFDSATIAPNGTSQYLLAEGENTDLVDFGYTGDGSIGDTVWNDLNGDGVHDIGEDGYAGVTLTLTGDLDGDGASDVTITTVTDADGNYLFDGLFLGDYTVTVDDTTLPLGTNPTYDLDGTDTANSSAVTLDALELNREDVDFGYNSQGTIGDTVWYDADADGIQNADEAGLANITVTLNGPGGPVVVTTDANGNYLFDQLAAGDYIITLSDLPAGMNQTADPDGGNDDMASVSLAGGETNLDQDFGYTGAGSIGDTIWNDTDGDGTDNGGAEDGIAGVTVTLTGDVDNDGVDDILTIATDSNGHYYFDNLPEGDYTIVVDESTLPPGMNQTFDPEGAVDGSADVTLGGSEPMLVDTIDFGYQQTGTIGDTIWFDMNGDGVQNPGESGLTNVTVTLGGPGGTVVASTDSNGNYLFDNLAAGDYTITVSGLPVGMEQTVDPDATLDSESDLTLGEGEVNLDQDFAYTGTGSIGDTIWNDADGDRTDNSGSESGIAGVVVTLTGDLDNDGVADDVLTTTTDADGHYSFDQLPEGDYTIVVDETTLPPGMNQTFDPEGAVDGSADVTLLAGDDIESIDFGYQQTSTIGDTVWYDMDADGVQDPDELGLVNINITLTGDLDGDGVADDTLTTATDENGNYIFADLPVGEYTITVDPTSLPGGMEQTYDFDDLDTANTATLVIGANESNLDVDFGYTGTGTIGDTLWLDVDGDGHEDAGEPGLGGASVTLTGDLDNDGDVDDTVTVVTDQNGHYSFPNLPAGDYTIEVDPATLPDGMNQTGDPDGTLDNITEISLPPGETNILQDFGYTGTGSIGDIIWLDSNRNGVLDGGESGIGGVSVVLTADFDGNGTVDFTTITTTDANGNYLFSNLPAGSYSLNLDPATVPGGLEQTFDPDGLLNFQTTLTLGASENNMVQDFGFAEPVVPPVGPPTPPIVGPVGPPTPPIVGPPVPADVLLMYQFNQSAVYDDETFWVWDPAETFMPPPIPVSPVYTGHAEPGTTISFILYDAMGNAMGYQTVMADSGGNWLANFTGSLLYDMPHSMAIGQTESLYNESTPGLFNFRSYFNPTMTGLIFSSTRLDLQSISAYEASSISESMHSGHNTLFNLGWNDSSGYEFLIPSINPAQHKR